MGFYKVFVIFQNSFQTTLTPETEKFYECYSVAIREEDMLLSALFERIQVPVQVVWKSFKKGRRNYLEEPPYHWIGMKVSVVAVSYSTWLLSTGTVTERTRHPTLVRLAARKNVYVKRCLTQSELNAK